MKTYERSKDVFVSLKVRQQILTIESTMPSSDINADSIKLNCSVAEITSDDRTKDE